MQERETEIQKHMGNSRQFLNAADELFELGDFVQVSEKLWGATAHAVKTVCFHRSWRHGRYAHLREAVNRLTEETGDGSLIDGFNIAYSHHLNFYNDAMEEEDVGTARARIRRLVDDILAVGLDTLPAR
jgi:uncharacterized protein (UPF0332 family)